MKRIVYTLGYLLLAGSMASAATNDLSATLQKGLFEEEANHDLNAAVRAYQDVVNQFDKDRKLAATAIFRLGECYRKQGHTNEANAQYQRVMREFADQTELANLSRSYVSVAGAAPGASVEAMTQQDAARAAAKAEDVEVQRIQSLLKDSPDLINAKDPHDGYTLLQRAAAAGQLEVAKFLLANGADIEAKNPNYNGYTALHFAADAGNKAMVEFLLSKGAKVSAGDQNGETPLHLAVQHGYRSLAESLVEHRADVNAKTQTGATPLHVAAANGFPSLGEFLISHGAEVNALTTDVRSSTQQVFSGTPLHIAAKRGDVPFASLLLTNKADVNATDASGQTPLHFAVNSRQPAVAELLLSHGANVDVRDKRSNHGWTPLLIAVRNDENDIVKLLLTNKANANIKFDLDSGNKGWTPLLLAVNPIHLEVVRSLLEGGAQPNQRSDKGDEAIFWSLWVNDVTVRTNVLELLLDHGAEVDARDAANQTPLMRASWDRDPATVQLLLKYKADPNASDNQGRTALHYLASRFENSNRTSTDIPTMARMLISAGANVNALDKNGATPLANLSTAPRAPRLPGGPQSGTLDAARSEFVALLREHGGVQDMPLPDRIQVRGPDANYSRYVFAKGTNDWNRFSLLELIGADYDLLAADPNVQSSEDKSVQRWASGLQTLGFPDFSRITIRGLGPSGGDRNVDLGPLLNTGDCSKDVPLAWGEVVEIPQADHLLREVWEGFTAEQFMNLKKCLTRAVEIVVKGKASRITLAPDITFTKEYVTRQESEGKITTGQKDKVGVLRTGTSFWLRSVLLGSHLVLTSSDLSRVKITRTDRTTGQKREWVVDCSEGNPDFWVNDGDVIEVPEK